MNLHSVYYFTGRNHITWIRMNIQKKNIFKHIGEKEYRKKYSFVKMCSFVSLLVKAEVIREVGLPIGEYFIWTDDYEYTGRIKYCVVIHDPHIFIAKKHCLFYTVLKTTGSAKICPCVHIYVRNSMNSKTAAVVVTYNRKDLLEKCIDRLRQQKNAACDIIIVDNASTDGTADMIKCQYSVPEVIYMNTGANLGGAGGFQYGVKQAVLQEPFSQ